MPIFEEYGALITIMQYWKRKVKISVKYLRETVLGPCKGQTEII